MFRTAKQFLNKERTERKSRERFCFRKKCKRKNKKKRAQSTTTTFVGDKRTDLIAKGGSPTNESGREKGGFKLAPWGLGKPSGWGGGKKFWRMPCS